MDFLYIAILALIQGLTEFLPVSSSGHLGLFHCFTDQCDKWDDENLAMDIAVHVGTLFSVVLYFYKDILKMLFGLGDIATRKGMTPNARLLVFVILSSIPVILAGLVLHMIEPDWLKTLYVIAWMTVIFGIVLWHADAKFPEEKSVENLTLKDAIIIGLAQMLALIPGTSRSGITMTAARYAGFSRTESAHYSLLLSIVAISGAGALMSLDIIKSGDVSLGMDALIAVVISFAFGWLAIAAMMKFLKSCSFKVFAIYRIALGGLLLALLYSGYIG